MNEREPIRTMVIVGGGTAGWMTAAAAALFLNDGQRRITLIESDAIGTVGVGEATIPTIVGFNQMLGISEEEFLRATQGSYKLGIEFVGWGGRDESYIHPFGRVGQSIHGLNFHQLWLKLRGRPGIGGIEDYAISAAAGRKARFGRPHPDPRSPLSGLGHAYHFDAGLYAAYLRRRAEKGGVRRVEGRIVSVERDPLNGHVAAVRTEDGRRIEGDLFVDCSGFRALLIGDAMGVPFEDWSRWLPCDRAIAAAAEESDPLVPLTRATAREAAWQWRIPLQRRTGNGIVYASAHLSDDEAERLLLGSLDTPAAGAPRRLRFVAGRRARMWEGNVIAIGLSAGFLEPLESTSIHLIQSGISKMFALFPDRRFTSVERDQYNRLMTAGYDGVRDFIIAHYVANQRFGEPFWDALRTMAIPDSLAARLALFREKGRIFRYDDELFDIPNWAAILIGQNILPEGHDPVADSLDEARVADALRRMRSGIAAAAEGLPLQAEFLARSGALTPGERGAPAGPSRLRA